MRLSTLQLARESRRCRPPSGAGPAIARSLLLALGLGLWCGIPVAAQPPGTDPPAEVFPEAGSGESDESLPIQGFLFLSEAGSPVMMPGMTWEEIQRLRNLAVGTELPSQAYSYQDMEIVGTADARRAELAVTIRFTIESTANNWMAIPLRMGNFLRVAPPDVTGVEEYYMSLANDGEGHLLWVKTTTRRDAMLRMNVSARVSSDATRSLDFRLPDVPSTVRLTVPQSNVTGDVSGQGYETIDPQKLPDGRTEFVVVSGGGAFTVLWGGMQRKRDDAPALEVTSRINVTWESPQNAPRAAVQLTFQNVLNSIDAFEIRLPPGSSVPEDATLGAGGQPVTFGPPIPDPAGERRRILIPKEVRKPRIDLNFSLSMQLPSGNVSASNPLPLRVPEVIGALRHRGEITVQTSNDYRLRWNAEPWVRSVLGEPVDETTAGRTYLFQFDRSTFDLPLWLSAKKRQVRINATSSISFRETTAHLEMLIHSSDRSADARGPQIDMAQWRLESIENADTGEPMDTFQGDGYPEIDYPPGTGAPPPIRIQAHQTIDPSQELIVINLPRLVKTDDGLLVPTSTVEIVNSGRSLFVVDLESSEHLERLVAATSETSSNSTLTRFRVDAHDAPAVLVGTIVEQPPRITLASDTTVVLDGNQLQTTIDWTVTSRLDLEGVLPIRAPQLSSRTRRDARNAAEFDRLFADEPQPQRATDPAELWSVTVGGVPAALHPLDENRFDLVSERLTEGTMSIRWTRTQVINSSAAGDSFESLSLPRPAIEDVTIRGPVRISLRGTIDTELLSASSPSSSEILLDAIPPDPVRLRLRLRDTPREELSVSQVVQRTAVGRSTRHEQVLARVQGGDAFTVQLRTGISDVVVDGYIDMEKVTVVQDKDTLIVPLPGDQSVHVVDLRVWIAENSPTSLALIEPSIRLPVGVGRVQWQVIVPSDCHLVWASPTLGRSMIWSFSPWNMGRLPSHDDADLTAMIGAAPHPMPVGNHYLYVGSDVRSFQAFAVSRVVLWLIVGAIVLTTALMLTHVPKTRHPMSAVVGAMLFAGLLAIAPDAAVLAGHFGVIALVLVIVMIAVRSLVTPRSSDRILASREARRRAEASTHSLAPPAAEKRSSVTHTHVLPPPSPTEVTP
jgi:hypothetical protein